MRFPSLAAAAGLLLAGTGAAVSTTSSPHAVHEKRDLAPSQWLKRSRLDPTFTLPVRIALKQRNLDVADDVLMRISDPASTDYGKHWTPKDVEEFFAPSDESIRAVRGWLHASGIDASRIKDSNNRGWLSFDAPAAEVERLLGAEYYVYDHADGSRSHVACHEYSVPEDMRGHVELITPTVHFDARPEKVRGAGALQKREITGHRRFSGGPARGRVVPQGQLQAIIKDLKACGKYITLPCLRLLYRLPIGGFNADLSSLGIVEFAPETFLQSDLDLFWSSNTTNDARVPVGTAPIFAPIDGGFLEPATNATEGFGIQGEPDLDLQYAMGLVYPQRVTLYQVGDNGVNAAFISFNNFLDAIDKSYCTFDGGDDPTQDESFPDPGPGGFKGQRQCGTAPLTKVISVSYGYNEHDLTPKYEARQCLEYLKLGLQGVSVFFSSGDNGVAGNGDTCIDPATGNYNNGTSGRFNPSFPGACPYVTSVGATQIKTNGSVTAPEVACETVIYSGGGFSNNFPIPKYQKAAVGTYFANYTPPYTAAQYNNTRKARGFPDVSANGANYVVAIDGQFELVFGTSASAPTFASVVTILNDYRAKIGKPSLGFLNPAFYAHPEIFNDIVGGTNPGCGTPGFTAVPGWDPVTGLGTPNFSKMLPLALKF